MPTQKDVTRIIILVLIIGLFVLSFLILRSILVAIIFGLLCAYILSPVYKKILQFVKEKNTATIILILALIVAITLPLWFLTPILIKQIFETYMVLQKINFAESLQKIIPSLFTPEMSQGIAATLNNMIAKTFSSLLSHLTDLVLNVANFILQFAVFIFTFYFGIRDGDKMKEYLAKVSPFTPQTEKKFLDSFRKITNAIIYGQFLIGLVQGLFLGLGMWIIGVPQTLVLTVIAIIVSVIPVLGSWLVWLPVSIFLIISGDVFSGVVLFLYGLLFISTIDNILRTILMSRTAKLPAVFGLIGVIGGLYYFGIIGLILGPLILAYLLIIIEFYKEGKLNELLKE